MKKAGKNFWEHIYRYPSFNSRFGTVVSAIIFLFLIVLYLLYPKFSTPSEKLAFLNLMVQGATLVLGIFAAYYALRQLVETRFTSLSQNGRIYLRSMEYLKAIEEWNEAFCIKPKPDIFLGLAEAFLLLGDFKRFDQHIKMSEPRRFPKLSILKEASDQLCVLYLKCMRYLFVEDIGHAKNMLRNLVDLAQKEDATILQWDFSDIQSCAAYRELTGDSKIISDNLFAYLRGSIGMKRKQQFENGMFITQVYHPSQ